MPDSMPRVFTCTWSLFPVMDPVAAARFTVADRFAGLEIQCSPLGFWPTTVAESTLRELIAIRKGEAIDYTVYPSDLLNPAARLPEERARDDDLFRRSIDLAVRLESPVILIHPGVVQDLFSLERKGVPFATPRFDRERLVAEARERAIETLTRWADWAAAAGLVMPVENEVHVRHTAAPTAAILADIVRAVARPNVKVNFDTGHAFIGGGVAEEFAALRDKVVHFHLNDGRVKGVSEHLPLGDGVADFTPLASFMARFGGPLVLEIYFPADPVAAMRRSRAFLDRLLAGAGA